MNKQKARLKQELNRLRRQKSILWAGILFFVAILVWTIVSILTSQKRVKIDAELTALAKPFVPRLDTEVFGMIEAKRALSDEELSSFPIYVYYMVDEDSEGVLTNITDLSIDNSVVQFENNFE